jgi:predicted RNase H-like HicB family nuclease
LFIIPFNFNKKSKSVKNETKSYYTRSRRGGYWAEVPAIQGCMTQGETFDELLQNIYEAVEGCLSVDIDTATHDIHTRVLQIAV